MKIDWKHLATTEGYKSLKAAYIRDIQMTLGKRMVIRSKGEKDEAFKLFQWVIGRAKHYSCHTGNPVSEILTEWEKKRTYAWVNYYQDGRQSKFHPSSIKQKGLIGTPEYTDKTRKYMALMNKESITKKPRWTMARKKRGY